MAGRPVKVEKDVWIATARQALVEEGVPGLKVDRLANRLGVTRGGFYNFFRDRDALIDALLDHWRDACHFTPPSTAHETAAEAAAWFETFSHWLIEEALYDHVFDMAVREWARSEPRAQRAIEQADSERIETIIGLFRALGYGEHEAMIRGRVFYYHQIGYYSIDVRESDEERRRNAPVYLDVLCGADRLAAARH